MRALICALLFVLAVVPWRASGHDVPPSVVYRRASDGVNASAKAALELALAKGDSVPHGLFGKAVMVGPMLWRAMKPIADKSLLSNEGQVIFVIGVPEPVTVQGNKVLDEEQRAAFWRGLNQLCPGMKKATVRKARAEEIAYYWATISFDIEEPFFTIDTGEQQFVVQLTVEDGRPQLFWIDLVGDLRLLRPGKAA